MKYLNINGHRGTRRILAVSAFALALPMAASAQWTVINLHPAGATSSGAGSVANGRQGGAATIGGVARASLWSGSAASRVDLQPAGATSSSAGVVEGGHQVGYASFGGSTHAGRWSGTAASWVDLHPAGAVWSYAMGMDAGTQVGYASFGDNLSHAGLWFGTPGSWVDLHPGVFAIQSRAHDADGAQQVGYVFLDGPGGYLNFRASLWTGTPESWVNLHPAGAELSYCDGAGSGQQVGTVRFGGVLRASTWTGTAESWVDLHPAGMSYSQAYDAHGGQQVGYAWWAGSVDHGYHAGIWSGTAASWVDLHLFLPKRFSTSVAMGVWHDATYTYVVGFGYNADAQRDEALMWRRRR